MSGRPRSTATARPGSRASSAWVPDPADGVEVVDVAYLYDEAVAAGSDHAVVVADLEF